MVDWPGGHGPMDIPSGTPHMKATHTERSGHWPLASGAQQPLDESCGRQGLMSHLSVWGQDLGPHVRTAPPSLPPHPSPHIPGAAATAAPAQAAGVAAGGSRGGRVMTGHRGGLVCLLRPYVLVIWGPPQLQARTWGPTPLP